MMIKNTDTMSDNSFSVEEKVSLLQRPEAYPYPVSKIESRETYMSWLFFVDDFVYKLKKPVRYQYLDYRTLEARFRNCRRELRLNKKLAGDIYISLVPLTLNKEGELRLGGNGEIKDWLLKMKRIPEETMLDYGIRHNCVNEERLRQASSLLTEFYAKATPVVITGDQYRKKLLREIIDTYKKLTQPEYESFEPAIEKLSNRQLNFLDNHTSIFNQRALLKKIIEAHGDLRPEHVCLTRKPVIIDRLEFNRVLRMLDTAEELSYFAMECELLGNALPGNIFFETYAKQIRDEIDQSLILFYKIKRACLRAYLVGRHAKDNNKGDDEGVAKASDYLQLAEKYCKKFYSRN